MFEKCNVVQRELFLETESMKAMIKYNKSQKTNQLPDPMMQARRRDIFCILDLPEFF